MAARRVGARGRGLLSRALPRAPGPQLLLATDLHAGNVGDPAYDVLQHLLNCEERVLADPRGTARRMAGLLDLDAERVVLWLFTRAVQEYPQQPWLRSVAAALAPRT